MPKLVRRVERREVHHRAARLHNGIVGDDVLWAVGEEQADLDAVPDAEDLEAARRPCDAVGDLGIAVAAAEKVDAGSLRPARRSPLEERVHRRGRDRARPRHRVLVGLDRSGVHPRLHLPPMTIGESA